MIPCKGIGLFPKFDHIYSPWYEVSVDLIGLWSAKTEHFTGELYAMVCIEPIINYITDMH